jgi:hypothetical protein
MLFLKGHVVHATNVRWKPIAALALCDLFIAFLLMVKYYIYIPICLIKINRYICPVYMFNT